RVPNLGFSSGNFPECALSSFSSGDENRAVGQAQEKQKLITEKMCFWSTAITMSAPKTIRQGCAPTSCQHLTPPD
ncbi:hypothetical protein, partial [Klebsiella pneumoniae]|uniref:hypothetical protein n=1 Tax=Klebsiella pneumoniae TaxID=573 RepID=UPI001C129C35